MNRAKINYPVINSASDVGSSNLKHVNDNSFIAAQLKFVGQFFPGTIEMSRKPQRRPRLELAEIEATRQIAEIEHDQKPALAGLAHVGDQIIARR